MAGQSTPSITRLMCAFGLCAWMRWKMDLLPCSSTAKLFSWFFDLSDPTTFKSLQQWIKASDLTGSEVQICVGNKANRLPSHFGHTEYQRRLMKRGESSSDPHPEFMDFGIDRAEGGGLLAEEQDDNAELRRRACIEWCTKQGIEYIEACAINEAFDKCMSIGGDLQGVPRILDALSAHMWPGLVMKSTQK